MKTHGRANRVTLGCVDRTLLETPLVMPSNGLRPAATPAEAARLRALAPEDYWLEIARDLAWTTAPSRALDGTFGVINVAGHRLGTMELEAALLTHAAVSEAAVVVQPDEVKGTVPVAFVVLRAGHVDSAELRTALSQAVVDSVGAIARPARIVVVSTVPRTRSGKIMRRVLRDLLVTGAASGDLSSLDNPDSLDVVLAKLGEAT